MLAKDIEQISTLLSNSLRPMVVGRRLCIALSLMFRVVMNHMVGQFCLLFLLLTCGCTCSGEIGTSSGSLATDREDDQLTWRSQSTENLRETFTLYNSGNTPILVPSWKISGSNRFRVVGGSSDVPMVLYPGRERGVTFHVESTSDGASTELARFVVVESGADNLDGEGRFYVGLQRDLLRGHLDMSCGGVLAFKDVRSGKARRQIRTLRNEGQAPIHITHARYDAQVGGRAFSLGGHSFPITLAVGQAIDQWVRFAPTVPSEESDLLLAPNTPQPSIKVTGTANHDRPCLKLETVSIQTKKAKAREEVVHSFRVTNAGGAGCDALPLRGAILDGRLYPQWLVEPLDTGLLGLPWVPLCTRFVESLGSRGSRRI